MNKNSTKLFVGAIALVAFSGLGCGKKAMTVGGGGAGASVPNAQWRDMTKDQCGTQTPKTATILGTWRRKLTAVNGATQSQGLVITSQTITLTNTCTQNTLSHEATTGSLPMVLTSNKVSIQQANSKTVGDRQLLCAVSLAQGDAGYKLVGNCLVINLGGQAQYFLHEPQ